MFDLIALAARSGGLSTAAHRTMAAGLLDALLAAPFGFLHWRGTPRGTRARRTGAWHGGGNVVVALFGAAWCLREADGSASEATLALSLCGVTPSLVAAGAAAKSFRRVREACSGATPHVPRTFIALGSKHGRALTQRSRARA